MNNFFRYILPFILVFYFSEVVAFSYSNFNNKYRHNNYQGLGDINVNISDDDEETLFIVDFSNSMNKKIGFSPKVYCAIDAIRFILNKSGDRKKIGLRIFGVTDKPIISEDRDGYYLNKKALCSASSLVLPVARYNSTNISEKLGRYTPQGVSPIGYSLRQAVQNDFSRTDAMKHIILVTDGIENCGDDPCMYIKKLMTLRDDIKIDVIGINIGENAYSQLNCIAKASKGKFYDVNTQEDFVVKIQEAFYTEQKFPVKVRNFDIKEYTPDDSGIKYKNFMFEF